MNSSSLSYVCSKEEVGQEIDEPIYDLPKKEQGLLLTINEDAVVEEGSMFERGMYLTVFIVCVLLMRYQWICFRNRCWKRKTHTWTWRRV